MTSPGRTDSSRRGRPPIDIAARREELLDAAERVIERGIAEPSIADIAAEAGYARTVVYAAFPNLPAVAYALTKRHTARLIEENNELLQRPIGVPEMLHATVEIICRFVDHNPRLYPLLMQTWVGPGDTTTRPLFGEIVDWATGIMATVLTRAGIETSRARPWAASIVGATLLTAEDWNDRRDRSRDDLVEDIVALMLPGLTASGAAHITGPITPQART